MHLPYIQLANEIFDHAAPEIAVLLSWTEEGAFCGLARMFRWALGRVPDGSLPSQNAIVKGAAAAKLLATAARYQGDPEAFVDACCHSSPPILERVKSGIRVRGLDRYDNVSANAKTRSDKAKRAADTRWDARRMLDGCSGDAPEMLGACSMDARAMLHDATDTDADTDPEKETESKEIASSPRPRKARAKIVTATDPRHGPLVKAMVLEAEALRGKGFKFNGGRDARAVAELLAVGPEEEILRRWRIGLKWDGYPRCDNVSDLAKFWNAYQQEKATGPPRAPDLRKSPVRAEDIPAENFKKLGVVDGF